jgi:hypothetical protein
VVVAIVLRASRAYARRSLTANAAQKWHRAISLFSSAGEVCAISLRLHRRAHDPVLA